MNGDETKYLNNKFIELNTKFEERWDAHDKASTERWVRLDKTGDKLSGKIELLFKEIGKFGVSNEKISTLEEQLNTLKTNDLHSINKKINALLFTVLASVFALIIVFSFKFLIGTTVVSPIVIP